MKQAESARAEWLRAMHKIAFPVLSAAAENRLHDTLPLDRKEKQRGVAYLEAVGRTMIGIAPWLELSLPRSTSEEERALQKQYRAFARKALANICNPCAADYCVWNQTGALLSPDQPLVDAAFLASALLKAPTQLFTIQPPEVRGKLLAAFEQARLMRPVRNNWLLFAATIEAMRYRFTGIGDGMRIEYALSKHFEWYKGDGAYGDGDAFHWDYYNSFVIQPMLEEVSRTAEPLIADKRYRAQFVKSLMRYCEWLERMISPDGSYPCMGRSIVYRTGAFHALAHAALSGHLPPSLPPGQVRRALSLALRKMFFLRNYSIQAAFCKRGFPASSRGWRNLISTPAAFIFALPSFSRSAFRRMTPSGRMQNSPQLGKKPGQVQTFPATTQLDRQRHKKGRNFRFIEKRR